MKVTARVMEPQQIEISVTVEMTVAQWELVISHLKWDGPSNALRDGLTSVVNQVKARVGWADESQNERTQP